MKKNKFLILNGLNKNIFFYFFLFLLMLIIFYGFYSSFDNRKLIIKKDAEINDLITRVDRLELSLSSLKDEIFLLKNLNYSDEFKKINKNILILEKNIKHNSKILKETWDEFNEKFDKQEIKAKEFLDLKKSLSQIEYKKNKNILNILKDKKDKKSQTENLALDVDNNEYKIIEKISKIEKKIIKIKKEEKVDKKNIKEDFFQKNNSYLFNYDKNNSIKLSKKIIIPDSLKRIKVKKWTFSEWIRNLPLKKDFDWVFSKKWKKLWAKYRVSWVLNWDIWKNQQCADSVIRLWWEYNYAKNTPENIQMKLENNVKNPFLIKNLDRDSFKKYMNYQFVYSSTYVLKRDLNTIDKKNILPWDLIVLRRWWTKTGHVYMIMDVAKSDIDWKIKIVLWQWDMPSQDFVILKNKPYNAWYSYYNDEFTEKNIIVKISENLKTGLSLIFKDWGFIANLINGNNESEKKIKAEKQKEELSWFNSWFDLDTFLIYAEKNDPNWKPILKRFF